MAIGISSSFNEPEWDTLKPKSEPPVRRAHSSRRMVDGETRIVKASRDFSMYKHSRFSVEAERIDCDSPIVNLRVSAECLSMTDVEALDLIDRLQRALSMLPSSK